MIKYGIIQHVQFDIVNIVDYILFCSIVNYSIIFQNKMFMSFSFSVDSLF